MTKEQKELRKSLNSNDAVERHMAQDLAFARAVESTKKPKPTELSPDEAQALRDFEQYANK